MPIKELRDALRTRCSKLSIWKSCELLWGWQVRLRSFLPKSQKVIFACWLVRCELKQCYSKMHIEKQRTTVVSMRKKRAKGNQSIGSKDFLQSYSNQHHVLSSQGSMQKNREPRNRATWIFPNDFRQWYKSNPMESQTDDHCCWFSLEPIGKQK